MLTGSLFHWYNYSSWWYLFDFRQVHPQVNPDGFVYTFSNVSELSSELSSLGNILVGMCSKCINSYHI